MKKFSKKLAAIFVLLLLFPILNLNATTLEEELAAKRQQIDALQQQIDAYQNEITAKQKEAKTYSQQIQLLASKIKKMITEIKALEASIQLTETEITSKKSEITDKEKIIEKERDLIAYNLWKLYQYETDNALIAFLKSKTTSDYLDNSDRLTAIEKSIFSILNGIKDEKQQLEEAKATLEEQQIEQEKLQALREVQAREVQNKKAEQDQLLSQTKQRTSQLKTLLNLTASQVEQLKNEMYYLQRNGVSLEDAIKYGQIVAERAGIRPAFLIALLEIESGLGTNIGSGRYKTDMNPNQWDYFLQITTKLGKNPDVTPVSKKPSYGWGGAMGAAQFLPGTWLGYEAKISQLTGHATPNPWLVEDSFMAAAIKLANDGASSKTRSGELGAAKQYLSGNPNCAKRICNWYANAVMDKSAEIEKNLSS